MMSKLGNMRAVKRLADELLELEEETLDWDDIGILIDIADGFSTEADYLQFKALRAHALSTEASRPAEECD